MSTSRRTFESELAKRGSSNEIVKLRRTAVLCDPHWLWLESVERVLLQVEVTVLGKATAVDECTSMIAEKAPDILISDVSSPELIDAVAAARQRYPHLKIIVFSALSDETSLSAAFGAGANAYVLRTAHPDDLALAVRQVFEHSVYFASTIPPIPPAMTLVEEGSEQLTRRELEILSLAVDGRRNAVIAKMLNVSEQTVKFHLSNVYRKLKVSNRTEASRWAQLRGVGSSAPSPR